jgi:hypothetical protein
MNKVKEGLKKYSQAREAVMLDESLDNIRRDEALLKIDQEVTMFAALMMGEFAKAIDRDRKISTYNRSQ